MNKKLIMVAIMLSGTTLLAGCATGGSSALGATDQAKLSHKLVKGVTTEAQARVMLGTPNTSTFTGSGDTIWQYNYAHEQAKPSSFIPIVGLFTGGSKGNTKTLTLLFTKKGVLKNYSYLNNKYNSGL